MTEQQQNPQLHVDPLTQNAAKVNSLPESLPSQTREQSKNVSESLDPSKTNEEQTQMSADKPNIQQMKNAQEIPFFNSSKNETLRPEAIKLQQIRQDGHEEINSKESFDGDLNDHDIAELISDCESQGMKRITSDNGSATVDVNGFDDGIDNQNDDVNSHSSRSKSRSRRSSQSNGSPELSIDDVSISDEEEQEKISINSQGEIERPELLQKSKRSSSISQGVNQKQDQIQSTKQGEVIAGREKQEDKREQYQKRESSQTRTLQKSGNDSTTCSTKTMNGPKNVTTSAGISTKPNLQLPVGNSNLKSIAQPAEKQIATQPSVERVSTSQNLASGRTNQYKQVPRDEDSILGQQFKRFQNQIETKEVAQHTCELSQKRKDDQNKEEEPSESEKSSTTSENIEKDNEDPTAPQNERFDPKELKQVYDGWHLYKKKQINFAPVRRYQALVDQDYKRNKVTVCAHLQNCYNSFITKNGRPAQNVDNYFNLEKLINKFSNDTSPLTKDDKSLNLKKQTTSNNDGNNDYKSKDKKDVDFVNNNNVLLTKSGSTQHIPDNPRAKNSKRAYANFDKELSQKMFGYRVNFNKKAMRTKVPKPEISQAHKPLSKFIGEVTHLLTKDYPQIPKYHTKQRILVPVNSDSDEEEEDDAEMESPFSMRSPQNEKKEIDESDEEYEDDEKESPSLLENTQTGLKSKLKKKPKGELITVRLRNGDKQTYRKRCRNLMWKVGPPERQGSATSIARRAMQRGRTTDTIGSPTKTTSLSPKKLGKEEKDANANTVMNGIRHLNIVRYQKPRQGYSLSSHQQKQKIDGHTQYGGNYLKRQNSGNKTAAQHPFDRRDSAKGGRRLRASGENRNTEFFEGNDREVQSITNGQENQSTVYLMDSNAQKKNQKPQANNKAGNLINPGILPKDPSLMKPGESQTLVIELSEEQTRLLEAGQLTANGVPIPKDLNKLTYEQIIALLNSLSLPVEVSKSKSTPAQPNTHHTPNSNTTSRQTRMQNASKYKQSMNTTNPSLMSHPMSSEKKQGSSAQNDGGVLNSASFINIKRTGIYTNQQNKSEIKPKGGKQNRPDSSKRSRQHKQGSFYDEDIRHGNQRSLNNPSQMLKGKNYNGMNQNQGKAMGEPERNMLQNVNRQQQQLLHAQQYKQQSVNYEQARKMNGNPTNFQQTIMGQQRNVGPTSSVQNAQLNLNGQVNYMHNLQQAGKAQIPMVANAQKKQEPLHYGELMKPGNQSSMNQKQPNNEHGKQSMTRLGSKKRLNNQKKVSNSDPQQIAEKNLFNNMQGSNTNSARQSGQAKSAQQTKHQQQQLVQLSSNNYQNETNTQQKLVTGRFDDRNKSHQPMSTHQVYQDVKSMGNTTNNISPFNQGSVAMSSTGMQQAKSTDGSTNQQALSSLNRYYQSLNQGSASSQANQDVRQHAPQLSQSTKNKSSKKTISLEDSIQDVKHPNPSTNISKNPASSQKPSKQPYQQNNRDKMNNSKIGQTSQQSSSIQPTSNRAGAHGSVKQITGPCTQYYNKLNEQESQLTAYRMRISQTHMNNTNNQNPAQKRKIESALASSAIQAIQQPAQAQAANNFKAARENQANYMKSFVPVDQKLPAENLFSKQGAPTQNNNFMHRSGEFKRNNGIQQQAPQTNGDTNLMQRTAQTNYKSGQADYAQTNNMHSSSLKMPNGQKLVNMANAYGQVSMTEINSSKPYAGQKPHSNQMGENNNGSSLKQNQNPFASKQYSKAGQAMNAASIQVSSNQVKAAQTPSGNGSTFNSSTKGQPISAVLNRQGVSDFYPQSEQK